MRVLMITHAYPPTFGGVESHVWDISQELAARGDDVLVVAGGEDAPAPGVVPVHRHRAISVQALLATRAGLAPTAPPDAAAVAGLTAVLADEVARFRPDVIHIHNAHHFGPELARACLDVAQVPVVNSLHDRVGEHLYADVVDWPWALVVFISDYLREALPSTRPAVTRRLGIDLADFAVDGPRDERLTELTGPVIFHPARLLRWKGVECGVRAFGEVHRDLGGSLVLCASENIVDDPVEVREFRRELVELADELGVGHAVHFMSFDRQQISSAYRAADLIWYPTIDEEPLGLVPIEAMACGVPLVVSRSGGMKETVLDGETGLVVPKQDPGSLAAAARKLLSDTAARESMVRAGITWTEQFSQTRYVDWLQEAYQSVINASGV
ncbi:glycosyltransferase family 4 protein [Labedaea rhizosphaerae]|uniref:Glycosyltransferase involved in cell wall biosynthesis n=1 Tax=Labedaea rhizosphaerae TaxID=598644 RepID=A0A4R6S098_LABRH|nr:glycosyltransferase family 4 protein [Labedaea rhizosphaerae]TDP92901.1 glycosyltransferase involved in cell wall biosynthesis [Labedaea rhizosphaerae]